MFPILSPLGFFACHSCVDSQVSLWICADFSLDFRFFVFLNNVLTLYHAACKGEFQQFHRSYSQLTNPFSSASPLDILRFGKLHGAVQCFPIYAQLTRKQDLACEQSYGCPISRHPCWLWSVFGSRWSVFGSGSFRFDCIHTTRAAQCWQFSCSLCPMDTRCTHTTPFVFAAFCFQYGVLRCFVVF